MHILAVDIGTGTQDILLLDPRLDIENAFKLILPSPTMIVRRRIQAATHRREAILLNGVMMGGGPCAWAAEDHLRAGLPVFATPSAATTFNDDLTVVSAMGVQLLSEDEANLLPSDVRRIPLRDFDYPVICRALAEFGLDLVREPPAAVCAAVFDHGAAPPEISDRQFRFDYLDACLRSGRFPLGKQLSSFAYPSDQIPASMTRLQAVAQSAGDIPSPLIVMDTAPAAILGAAYDPQAARMARNGAWIALNIGNFHTIAVRSGPRGIEGIFEHHTGLIELPSLESLLARLAGATLRHSDVFSAHGHGALMYTDIPMPLAEQLVVTGPRRGMLALSSLKPHFAVPFGDMMVAGCFGLLSAAVDILQAAHPALAAVLQDALHRHSSVGLAPWDA